MIENKMRRRAKDKIAYQYSIDSIVEKIWNKIPY